MTKGVHADFRNEKLGELFEAESSLLTFGRATELLWPPEKFAPQAVKSRWLRIQCVNHVFALTLLGLHRMPDATVFSIDVAVAKARNVIYLSTPAGAVDLPGVPSGTAVTHRTIGFGAQPLFPPGINNSSPGPFFNLFLADLAHPCTQGAQPANPNQNGVVFFPGSLPLYKNGVLVGGLGVSGDGVDQDDYVTNAGGQNFAPTTIRADQVTIDSVRLPYLKFPRNPTD
jgi:uncharacterized protein GlcG (DUF336 family)